MCKHFNHSLHLHRRRKKIIKLFTDVANILSNISPIKHKQKFDHIMFATIANTYEQIYLFVLHMQIYCPNICDMCTYLKIILYKFDCMCKKKVILRKEIQEFKINKHKIYISNLKIKVTSNIIVKPIYSLYIHNMEKYLNIQSILFKRKKKIV